MNIKMKNKDTTVQLFELHSGDTFIVENDKETLYMVCSGTIISDDTFPIIDVYTGLITEMNYNVNVKPINGSFVEE
jgi:hypothetical protein